MDAIGSLQGSVKGRQGFPRPLVTGLLVLLVTAIVAAPARAAVGDFLTSVEVPDAALCGEGSGASGTALALVPGSKVGRADVPIALVTSCNRLVQVGDETFETRSLLFFIDPAIHQDASPEVVATVITSVTASNGWGALVVRPDKGDLLACTATDTGTALYAIKYSVFDATPGQATLVRNGPAGGTCDGIAWDPVDNVVYQTSTNVLTGTGGRAVLRFPETGTAAPVQIPSGCTDFLTGVHVAGVSLFVACTADGADGSMRQIDKATGLVVVRSFPLTTGIESGVSDPGDLEYDPVSFTSDGTDAVWTKGQFSDSVFAFAVPIGTLGQRTGAPVAFPSSCPGGGTPDADGDGLLDCWEDTHWPDGLPGIDYDGDGVRDIVLCVDANGNGTFGAANSPERATECASPQHRDVFVEIDYMQFHKPDPVAVNNVIAAFANSPPDNPDGTTGIRLHVQIGEQLTHVAKIALVPCTPPAITGQVDFDALKTSFFGTSTERNNPNALNAKRLAYHYAIFAHNQSNGTSTVTNTSSGCSEVQGNDFLVTLGSFSGTVTGHTGGIGTTDQQGGTLMHELGHNLGLRHGGGDNVNCKPNYESVMSYSRQFSTPVTPRPLDYSGVQLNDLDEAALLEPEGIGPFTGVITFGPPVGTTILKKPTVVAVTADAPIDWNINANATETVGRDVNNITSAGCPVSPGELLEGFDDWAHLQFDFKASVDFGDGAHATIDPVQVGTANQEIGIEEAREMSLDRDGDGVLDIDDNCPDTPNGGQDASACSARLKILGILINAKFPGFLGVAILSNAQLDATTIDPATVTLHGSQVNGGGVWVLDVKGVSGVPRCTTKNVGGNSKKDLICQLEVTQGQLPPDVSTVVLDARTFAGAQVQGVAAIKVHRTPALDVITETQVH
jgi:hypothetical protein